jgi:glycosyltransferase involved in cell wall biosynthesis
MNHVKVSVLIPTYNGQKYLEETIESVLAQTFQDFEIFVVDDGSVTAGPREICERYPQVQYHRKENGGVSSARNLILPLCKGEIIAFLDDDDVWFPTKLEKQVRLYDELMAKGITPGIIYTGHQMIDDGEILGSLIITGEGMLYEKLFFGNFVGTPSSVIVPRALVESENLRFDTTLRTSEDWDFFLGIARRHPIYCVGEVLTKYRNRAGSLTKNVSVANDCDNQLLHKHLERGRDEFSKEHPSRVELYLQKTSSYRYREAAYAALFERGNGPDFRSELAKAAKCHSSAVTPATRLYYFTSFLSTGLCKKLKASLGKEQVDRSKGDTIVVAVTDPNYMHMGVAINQMS